MLFCRCSCHVSFNMRKKHDVFVFHQSHMYPNTILKSRRHVTLFSGGSMISRWGGGGGSDPLGGDGAACLDLPMLFCNLSAGFFIFMCIFALLRVPKMIIVKYSINTYVRYLNYALLVIAELPNDQLTGNHTLSLPPLYL